MAIPLNKKPFNLSVEFSAVHQPRQGVPAFNLVAIYDPNGGGGAQYVGAVGFDTLTFGSIATAYTQKINVSGLASNQYGNPTLINRNRFLNIIGFDSSLFGNPKLENKQRFINPTSITNNLFGTHTVWNWNKTLYPFGFYSELFGRPTIYNLKQFLSLNEPSRGPNTALYGIAYLQGGVKYLSAIGLNASILPNPTVINTKADQFVNLNNQGISAPSLPNPNVSPRILYPLGIKSDGYGVPLIQRNPSPTGFINTGYGTAWISHSPRYILPAQIEAFLSGYPRVFDPTQKIWVTGVNTVISGGVFGDITARNNRRVLNTIGFDAHLSGDWSVVESNLRKIIHKGLSSNSFGAAVIFNKTPSITLNGFDSLYGLQPSIGYRIRNVRPSGFYQPKFGTHILTKPPEIKPGGIVQSAFGTTFISNHTRNIFAGLGRDTQEFGEYTVWFKYRYINTNGSVSDQYGTPRIEHGRRTLLVQGHSHTSYGNAWLSHAVRSLTPTSIEYPKIPIHYVGRHQEIRPSGFIATLFGSRIVPESQSIYPQGFINPFGLAVVDLWKKYIKPTGFLSTGQEGGHRFGTAKFWNLRQYIVQVYDDNSGLAPPKWTGWTSIENRNKTIGAIGSNFSRIGEPNIENKARPLLSFGIDAQYFGKPMIAERVRKLKLSGIESPYISSWSVIFNAAPAITTQGFDSQKFGSASITNTRRYFNRIGNFESLEMGKPMIADRIRTLKFEHRYTIAPPYIPIHSVHLYTRYIEEVGRFDDHQSFGNPSLSIHWNIITPRWTMRDAYGSPTIKNVTPELGARGRNSEEFGQTNIRTQWRELLHQGIETVLWGKSDIAFRDRKFSVPGFTQWNIPTHKVTKTGVPPYYPQYIWLDTVEIDGEQNDGHGIEPPPYLLAQVPRPSLRTNVLKPIGFVATEYGNHYTQSNGILVQPGLQELTIGNHIVGLKNRQIIVESIGDLMQVSNPRFSPHTIYAMMEAPEQAKKNHPYQNLHPINYHGSTAPVGEIFGTTTITLQHRNLNNVGLGLQSRLSDGHKLELRKRFINLTNYGFRSWRIGFHVVGPFDQHLEQFDSSDMQSFGRPSLSIPYGGAYHIKPNGISSPILNKHMIDFFNRIVQPHGTDQSNMGTRLNGDKPFMWQGLRVGELVKGNYGGFENEAFGQTWVSNKIRELSVNGFESFVCEYDYTAFDKRMRVYRKTIPRPQIHISPVGFDVSRLGLLNIKPAVHYIRPDGNADQFRKGAF
mgnify:CR=1 FL=1